MKVSISSSSRSTIDKYYIDVARETSSYLASKGYDLIYGGCSVSMMGACYEEFKNAGRKINIYTTKTYEDDLKNLDYDDCEVCDTTFDLKKRMFYDSEIVLILPGGPGTLAELLAFMEEKRSNNQGSKALVVYDGNDFYNKTFKVLDEFIENKFVGEEIYNFIKVAHNMDEFKKIIDSCTQGE